MSLHNTVVKIAQNAMNTGTIACTVKSTRPLKLKFNGDKKMTIDKNCLYVPKHVKGLKKGKSVLVQKSPTGSGYVVLGKVK